MQIIYALPQTINIAPLVNRTKCILQQLYFSKKETPWFQENLIPFLDSIGSIRPQSGFHDLFLKCLIYKKLFTLIDESSYLSFTRSNMVLFELLFNPGLEEQLLVFFNKENIYELMADFSKSAILLDDGMFSDKYMLLWESPSDFAKTVTSLSKYIRWYEKSHDKLPTHPVFKSEASIQPLLNRMANSELDVEMDQSRSIIFNDGALIGTTGLFPCIGILAIIIKNNEVARGFLFHSSDNHEKYIKNISNKYEKKGCTVNLYLFGGLPYLFHEYLKIIYQEKYPVKNIHLGIPTFSSIDCVCYSENNTIYITSVLTDSSPEITQFPKNKKTSALGGSRFFDSDSHEEENKEDRYTTKPTKM